MYLYFFDYLSDEKNAIKMKIFENFFHLFYPKLCALCDVQLVTNEKVLCTHCRHDIPIICETDYRNNKISKSFYGKIPIEKAISFLFYRKEGKTKQLIHQLKYKGNQEIGSFIGNWFGAVLKESNEFHEIDYIIPVPLHPKKLKKRGYNQLTTFGESLSIILKTPYKKDVLVRVSTSKTQTLKQRFDRFNNLDSKFFLNDTTIFKDKHLLLIDDVITTGATLEACCKELLKSEKCKISIVTMAFTE